MELLTKKQQTLIKEERQTLNDLLISLLKFGASDEDQETLRKSIAQLDEFFLLVVVGEFNAGKSAFIKFALRTEIDFPIVNCATAISNGTARICLNAVFNDPYRATKAEESIAGKTIDEANAEAAGTAAVSGNMPLSMNKFKVQIAKALVKRTILACA